MFEENDNIFPTKPVLVDGEVQNKGAKLIALGLLFGFIVINYFANAYVFLIELLLVLAFHEFGHFLMMRIYKRRSQGLFFMTFLAGLTKSFRPSTSQRKHVFINLMGPLPGILIGCALFFVVLYTAPNVYLLDLSILFVAINLLNLLPIDPFDGGRIVEILFFSQNDRAKMFFVLFSSLLIIGVAFYFEFYPLIIFGFLMGLKVRGYQKSMQLHQELEEDNINFKKEYKDLTNREYWKIRSVFLTNNPKLKEMIPSGYTLWENERLLMEQVRQLLRLNLKQDVSTGGKIAVVLILLAAIGLPLYLFYSNTALIEWYIENANF